MGFDHNLISSKTILALLIDFAAAENNPLGKGEIGGNSFACEWQQILEEGNCRF